MKSLNTLSKVKTKWKCSSWNSNSYYEDKILKNVEKTDLVFHMTCHKLPVYLPEGQNCHTLYKANHIYHF